MVQPTEKENVNCAVYSNGEPTPSRRRIRGRVGSPVPTPMRGPSSGDSSDPNCSAKSCAASAALSFRSSKNIVQEPPEASEVEGRKVVCESSSNKTANVTDEAVGMKSHHSGRFGLVFGIVLIFAGVVAAWDPEVCTRALSSVSGLFSGKHVSKVVVARRLPSHGKDASEASVQPHVESLEGQVASALACAASRADILDVLSGSSMEFGGGESLAGLSHLVRSAAGIGSSEVADGAELELQRVTLQLGSGTGPASLQRRLLAAIATPCESSAACSDQANAGLVPLKVDGKITSRGATSSSWFHRMLLQAGAVTGLRSFQSRARLFSSPSADVVLGPGPISIGDCFAFRGNATLAFEVLPAGAFVRSLVIEQPPRWATPKLGSSPRRFHVDAAPFLEGPDETVSAQAFELGEFDGSDAYSIRLGEFEYSMAAPAAQAFELPVTDMPIGAVRLTFESPGWGEPFTCVYRVSVYETVAPLCAGGLRVAAVAA